MSDSSHAARRRHEYMPNRMFDPAANPFAVQNWLIKEEQVFTVTTEERPEFGFESDPLVSKESADMFALDEVIELADLTGATAFASEANADSAFVAETSSAAADMTAAMQETAFMADAAMAAQSATGFIENTEQDDTVAATQSQDALAASTSHTDDADAGIYAETDADIEATSSVITENDLAVSDDVFIASAEAIESEAQAPELASEIEHEPVPATPAVASAPATPDLSGEAVTALVEAAREQARAETRELAYNEGLEAGKAQARAELQQEHDTQITQLKTLQEALQKLSFDADALFEPVKKLTVHLAEQLVRNRASESRRSRSVSTTGCAIWRQHDSAT